MRSKFIPIGIAAMALAGHAVAQPRVPYEFGAGQPARAAEVNANFAALVALIEGLEAQVGTLTARVNELETELATIDESKADSESLTELSALFDGVTRDVDTNTGIDTIRVSGVNLQIVNGTGRTDLEDGSGNLIIGYNEPGDAAFCQEEWRSEAQTSLCGARTGSHMVVIGMANDYQGYGGLIAGSWNQVGAPFSTAIGYRNTASGESSTATGGESNHASGAYTSVSGGHNNTASAAYATASGGGANVADGQWSTIMGGAGNRTLRSSNNGSIYGGRFNVVDAYGAAVMGGDSNQAGVGGGGMGSAITGGQRNTTRADYSVITGGDGNETYAQSTSILGGQQRSASTDYCVVGDDGNNC